MAADLNKLDSALKNKVLKLLENCKKRSVEMRPYDGIRTPLEQARLWRQSRAIEEINKKIADLEANGAHFLAECIRRAGPQNGGHVTDTPPGISWHQWGEALDCFWLVDGKAEWSTKKIVNGVNGYAVYAEEAKLIGLTAGGNWKKFKDWPHIQLRSENNAGSVMALSEINKVMKDRFEMA